MIITRYEGVRISKKFELDITKDFLDQMNYSLRERTKQHPPIVVTEEIIKTVMRDSLNEFEEIPLVLYCIDGQYMMYQTTVGEWVRDYIEDLLWDNWIEDTNWEIVDVEDYIEE